MNKILAVILLTLIITFSHLYLTNFIYPQTYLGKLPVAGLTQKQVRQQITAVEKIKLLLKDRVYEYPISKLGVIVESDKTLKDLFAPQSVLTFVRSLFLTRTVKPTLIFSQDFYHFTLSTVFNLSKQPESLNIDQINKTIVYNPSKQYKIDTESLKSLIAENYGTENILKPQVYKLENDLKENIHIQNQKLAAAFQKPLKIVIQKAGELQTLTITPAELKNLMLIDYLSADNLLDVQVSSSVFTDFYQKNALLLAQDRDKKVSASQLKADVLSAFTTRLQGASTDTVLAKIDYVPNSEGNLAPKYLEIDISQQKMYLFANGQFIARHNISSGLYYPTPTGQFKILNKALNAYSDLYHVWMPFWMAFYYGPKLNAYFGIHELPYWVAGDGTKIQRPREFLGSPHTGGCVALDIGVARQVYDFVEVGTPVYVFD